MVSSLDIRVCFLPHHPSKFAFFKYDLPICFSSHISDQSFTVTMQTFLFQQHLMHISRDIWVIRFIHRFISPLDRNPFSFRFHFFFFFSIFIVLNRKSITRPFLERKRNSGCEFSGMLWQFSKKHYGGMMSAKKAFRCEWENSADLENLFNRDLCFKEAVAWYFSSPGFTDI